MTDSQIKVVSVFDQYKTKAPAQAQPAPVASADILPSRAYKAYGLDAPQKRSALMTIHYGDGRIGLMQKSYLLEVLLTSHQYLSLFFSNCIITLEGERLTQLVPLFQEEKILSLHCFNPRLHDKPADDEIIINRIERRSAREILEAPKGQG